MRGGVRRLAPPFSTAASQRRDGCPRRRVGGGLALCTAQYLSSAPSPRSLLLEAFCFSTAGGERLSSSAPGGGAHSQQRLLWLAPPPKRSLFKETLRRLLPRQAEADGQERRRRVAEFVFPLGEETAALHGLHTLALGSDAVWVGARDALFCARLPDSPAERTRIPLHALKPSRPAPSDLLALLPTLGAHFSESNKQDGDQNNSPLWGGGFLGRVKKVVAGRRHCAALTDLGCLYTWGESGGWGAGNALGLAGTTKAREPTLVEALLREGETVLDVACTDVSTCILTHTGRVLFAGSAEFGLNGAGLLLPSHNFVEVEAFRSVLAPQLLAERHERERQQLSWLESVRKQSEAANDGNPPSVPPFLSEESESLSSSSVRGLPSRGARARSACSGARLFAGEKFCALVSPVGELWLWGLNDALQLTRPKHILPSGAESHYPLLSESFARAQIVVKTAALGSRHGLALDGRGDVYEWGGERKAAPFMVDLPTNCREARLRVAGPFLSTKVGAAFDARSAEWVLSSESLRGRRLQNSGGARKGRIFFGSEQWVESLPQVAHLRSPSRRRAGAERLSFSGESCVVGAQKKAASSCGQTLQRPRASFPPSEIHSKTPAFPDECVWTLPCANLTEQTARQQGTGLLAAGERSTSLQALRDASWQSLHPDRRMQDAEFSCAKILDLDKSAQKSPPRESVHLNFQLEAEPLPVIKRTWRARSLHGSRR